MLRETAAALVVGGATRSAAVTISLGIASYPAHARTTADLIKRADEALYRAKREGRDRTVLTGSDLQGVEPVTLQE